MMLRAHGGTGRRVGLRGLVFCGLLLVALGCEDGTTEPEVATLTMEEAVALFDGMRAIQQDTTSAILHASEDSTVVACPIGGRVRVTGSASESIAGDTLRLETDFTAAPAGCQFSQGGHHFTTDGDPGVREQTVVVIVGLFEHVGVEGTVAGSLDWQLDGRSGSCGMDLELTAEPDLSGNEPGVAGTLSGTLCDHDVELEIESVSGPGG